MTIQQLSLMLEERFEDVRSNGYLSNETILGVILYERRKIIFWHNNEYVNKSIMDKRFFVTVAVGEQPYEHHWNIDLIGFLAILERIANL